MVVKTSGYNLLVWGGMKGYTSLNHPGVISFLLWV